MLSYRWLEPKTEPADLVILDHIRATISKLGWIPLPSPEVYGMAFRIHCAFLDTQLVGWHVVQFFPHAEPLWVDPAYRGSKVAAELTEKTVDYLVTSNTRGFMIVAESPVVARLAEHYGLVKVEHPVYIFKD